MTGLLLLVVIASVSAAKVDDCTTSCAKLQLKDACAQGCLYAYALTRSHDPLTDRPTCKKACEDNFKGNAEQACETGCSQFEGVEDLPDGFGILNVIHQIMSKLFSDKQEEPVSELGSEVDENPITVSRIRIFIPLGQPDEDRPALPSIEEQQPTKEESPSDLMPSRVVFIHRGGADSNSLHVDERARCWFRHMLRAPFLLLFVVTLSTLFILLVVQLAVCIRRRRSTFRGYQYSPLPTYAEATNVKVSIADEDEVKQPLKHQEVDA